MAEDATRNRQWWRWACALAAVFAAAAGFGKVALQRDPDPPIDADAALTAMQSAVTEATTFRYTMTVEASIGSGPDETTRRSTGDGEWSAGDFRSAVDDVATIRSGDAWYRQPPPDQRTPGNEPWDVLHDGPTTIAAARKVIADYIGAVGRPGDPQDEDWPTVTQATASLALVHYAGSSELIGPDLIEVIVDARAGGSPPGYRAALLALRSPVTAEDRPSGGVVLTAGLEPPEGGAETLGVLLPAADVTVEVGPDDLPRSLRLRFAGEDYATDLEVRFTAWNEPVDIAIPAAADVDKTPLLEEVALREMAQQVPPLWPEHEPTGMETVAMATRNSPVSGASLCPGLVVQFMEAVGPQDWPAGTLSLGIARRDCVEVLYDVPFTPGGPAGRPSRPGLGEGLQVQFDEVIVEVRGNIPDDERDAVIGSLAPVEPEIFVAEGFRITHR